MNKVIVSSNQKMMKRIIIFVIFALGFPFVVANAQMFPENKIAIETIQHLGRDHVTYADKFTLQENCRPVSGLHYKLVVEDGQIIEGITNKKGETVTVYSTLKNARVDIYQTQLLGRRSSNDMPIFHTPLEKKKKK